MTDPEEIKRLVAHYSSLPKPKRKQYPSEKKWREANRDKTRKYNKAYCRDYNLRTKYGLTEADFKQMLVEQDSACAICNSTLDQEGNRFERGHVDHCHTTGNVRSILCGHCNMGLGHFRDSPANLQMAINYLALHAEKGGQCPLH